MAAHEIEYIRALRKGIDTCKDGQLFIARKRGDADVFTVKVVRTHGRNPYLPMKCDGTIESRVRAEQVALKVLTEERVPFVTQLHRSFHDQGSFYLMTDYCHGGDIQNRVAEFGPIPPEHALFYAAEMVEGICGIHAAGIIHRAIEPTNVFICADGHIMIAGFASAHSENFKASRKVASGIGPYQAPELVLGWSQDSSVDWWSFGLTLGFLLTGMNPFEDEADGVGRSSLLKSKILHRCIGAGTFGQIDVTLVDLILKCLERNAASRLKDEGVKRHAYFADV
ncbi:kinase-like protein [Obba rivulosa]|uniref:Kinase-like protein n=1 Tax=Obba rivulosa TaxID=1052685 RepID=A0A8E2AVR6_9APHY|nr:kinase-like protein [Obba rivulosa]